MPFVHAAPLTQPLGLPWYGQVLVIAMFGGVVLGVLKRAFLRRAGGGSETPEPLSGRSMGRLPGDLGAAFGVGSYTAPQPEDGIEDEDHTYRLPVSPPERPRS